MLQEYDVIVIGAGHAGNEAAAAATNIGASVLLITMDMTKMGQMSCNPAVGGIAKGQIVREIDALGGYSGIVTDKSSIQFRMLNRSKGPAMWSPRAQCDRALFTLEWRKQLENIPNLDFWQDMVTSLIIEDKQVKGVVTRSNLSIKARTVIVTSGTFLRGLMHVGDNKTSGGRAGEAPSYGISEQLKQEGITVGRMKTGTPPRLDGRTIDFSVMSEQEGDEMPAKFSYLKESKPIQKQRSCFITHTNIDVHEQLRTGFMLSPLFNGTIEGRGPRYCPSIEDKIVTFATKDAHQLFLEPEGWDTEEYYINGFSTSLPLEVQLESIRKVKGLENVKFFRPGYAIEYDFFDPQQLFHTLESKVVANLFLAGQVNGTTGYEEAAAQGLMAGINAALKIKNNSSLILARDEAYIGVLIDDLVNKGVDEPYRMFTSRAEYRILLRQDNADMRLTEKGFQVGTVSQNRYTQYLAKKKQVEDLITLCNQLSIEPELVNDLLVKNQSAPLKQKVKLATIILRPQVELSELATIIPEITKHIESDDLLRNEIMEAANIAIKYEGYIQREKEIADKQKRLEGIKLNPEFDYHKLNSLSTEARIKLSTVKPTTIGQASRISGVSPSDINVLLIHMKR